MAKKKDYRGQTHDNRLAWWHLKREYKQKLEAIRKSSGRFGGTPGRFPYIWVHEGVGNAAEKAGITPHSFMKPAVQAFENVAATIWTKD